MNTHTHVCMNIAINTLFQQIMYLLKCNENNFDTDFAKKHMHWMPRLPLLSQITEFSYQI